MSRNRFSFIFSNLRFDDKSTRQVRLEQSGNKLEPIAELYYQFNENCTRYLDPAHITIDERLATYRGKCPFRVYMRSKPGRYGIKIWAAADGKTGYILNSFVYTGKINNKREINQGQRVVLDLVQPYSNLAVTADNFFTSVPLVKKLLEKNLYYTGTVRMNKTEIPKEFKKSPKRPVQSSIFGFTDDLTMVSYVPQKNRSVVLLSSHIRENSISSIKNKPDIIIHYNKTKGAVDTGDGMTREYSCLRATRRWPFRLFLEILDMVALNAYVVWKIKNPEWQRNNTGKRKIFIEQLSLNLMIPNVIERRENNPYLHLDVKISIDLFYKLMDIPFEDENVPPKQKKKLMLNMPAIQRQKNQIPVQHVQ